MKLDDGDRLIGVATCREGQDVFLATRKGRCIRFELSDDAVRVFAGRDSSGVRGIRLAPDDEVIGLSVIEHVEASNDERAAYLKIANARGAATAMAMATDVDRVDAEEPVADVVAGRGRVQNWPRRRRFCSR